MQAQSEFRAVAQACQEDFSMPTYSLSKQQRDKSETAKVSVGGVFTNYNSAMYSESPFEKAVTNRDSKALLSNTKTEGMVPQSFWTFSNATSAGNPGSLVYFAR